jgi:peptide methionine sulfoxide reductase MsrA
MIRTNVHVHVYMLAYTVQIYSHVKTNTRMYPPHIHTHTLTYTDLTRATCLQVTYDSERTRTRDIVAAMLAIHDPTLVRAVGPHEQGTGQYRSCVWVTEDEQRLEALEAVAACAHALGKDLATEVLDLHGEKGHFYDAEDEHQEKEGSVQAAASMAEWLNAYGVRKVVWGGVHA